MFNKLTLINLPPNSEVKVPEFGEVFVLETCQRTIILGYNDLPFNFLVNRESEARIFSGSDAYRFLLETICGLKSRVVGESEIVGQFKAGHQRYTNSCNRSPFVCNVLEKLFKDSKKVRTDHLLEVGQNSYSGITKKLIEKRYKSGKVLILGSGALAFSLVKMLRKKHEVYISARNNGKVDQLCMQFGVEKIEWKNRESYQGFDVVVNTIGASITLLDQSFFSAWQADHSGRGIFVDLGSPSPISTVFGTVDGVYHLDDILDLGAMLDSEKRARVTEALEKITLLTENRMVNFNFNVPFGWGELKFA
jgi:glutamyl-tRNA reductase